MEGRKTFTNMLKYIKITASSNSGNIFAIVCASAFLPFLPMTSVQILLLNLLYDILCIVLPWDNVDEEETLSPRDWSGRTLGRFMLSFGLISSLFDNPEESSTLVWLDETTNIVFTLSSYMGRDDML